MGPVHYFNSVLRCSLLFIVQKQIPILPAQFWNRDKHSYFQFTFSESHCRISTWSKNHGYSPWKHLHPSGAELPVLNGAGSICLEKDLKKTVLGWHTYTMNETKPHVQATLAVRICHYYPEKASNSASEDLSHPRDSITLLPRGLSKYPLTLPNLFTHKHPVTDRCPELQLGEYDVDSNEWFLQDFQLGDSPLL